MNLYYYQHHMLLSYSEIQEIANHFLHLDFTNLVNFSHLKKDGAKILSYNVVTYRYKWID